MNILVVGAGSVGKIYGYHLALGGAKVSFFVKEKHADSARAGFALYPLNDPAHREHPVFWNDYSVLTVPAEVDRQKWDYVILAMSSPALRSGWLDNFLKLIPQAHVVSLQPGMNDHEYLAARISPGHLMEGTIHILSYEAPLPGGKEMIPGTAYWVPPGSFSAFSGKDAQKVDCLLSIYRKGKFSVKRVEDSRKLNVLSNPALTLFILALEQSDWSLQKLSGSDLLKTACQALPEAARIQAKKAGTPTPAASRFLTPLFFKSLMKLGSLFLPFDFEAYLKAHFTKVREQMHESLEQLIQFGKENKLPTLRLEALKREA